MELTEFGKTGLKTSKLVIGGGFVGGLLLHAGEEVKRTLLRRALAAGINWIDTAPSYGDSVSETVIGQLLQEMDLASDFIVSSKVGLDPNDLSDIEGQIRRSLAETLSRLRMNHLPLLQLHNQLDENAVNRDVVLGQNGVCEVFEKLQAEGLIGHGGFTAVGDTAISRDIIMSGRVASVQIYYNLLNPSAGWQAPAAWSSSNFDGLLQACADHDVAAMNIRVFAAGVLASKIRHGREIPMMAGAEVSAEERRAERVFAKLGRVDGEGAETALRFSLSEPRLTNIVIGLAELAHLETALTAVEKGPLDPEEITGLREIWSDAEY